MKVAARNPQRLPDYVLRDEPVEWSGTKLGRDPLSERLDDASHLAILPQVDARGAFKRESRVPLVLATFACLLGFIAIAGMAWALLRRFA